MDKVLQYFINTDTIIWYNVMCFVRMMIAYVVTCVIIPSFCLRSYLREKTFLFRIIFYQVIANVYINILGFVLAYSKTYCFFTVFIGIVVFPIAIKLLIERKHTRKEFFRLGSKVKSILLGTYGAKHLLRDIKNYILDQWKKFYNANIKNHKVEWLVIVVTIFYAILFWGYFRFHNPVYGHTDEETHLYWIRCIIENNAFVTGLYPYGMHFLIATLTTLFMIPADGGTLAMSIVTMSIVFIMIYFLARTIFKSRYAALFGWSFLIVTGMFRVRSYYRFEYIFPMEFSMIATLIGVYALISTVKNKDKCSFYLFAMSIGWSLYAHFYGTIILGLICIIFGIVYFIVIIKDKALKKYIVSGIIGILLGILPFCVGLLCGHEFEKSIDWAIGVFTDDDELINSGLNEVSEVELEESEIIVHWTEIFEKLGENAFVTTYIAKIACILWGIGLFYGVVGSIFRRKYRYYYMTYLLFSCIWGVLAVMSIASSLGMPSLLHENRAAGFLFVFSFLLFGIPLQILSDTLMCVSRGKKEKIIESFIIIIGAASIIYTFYMVEVKEELYFESIVSDADGKLFLDLVVNEEPYTWTVITTTNMLSMIKGDGYHMEILEVLENSEEGEDIYIPTPSIYVVIEKQVISYSEKLIDIDDDDGGVTYGSAISAESALDDSVDIYNAYGDSPDRAYYFNRGTIMSRLYYWALKIEETYPNEVSIYYEDDVSIIYLIEQDPYFLLNLSVDYMTDLEEYMYEN